MTLEQIHSILAIQSHVVHGYVGNKAATFPLQCLGWDVDALNTVNFSNHTGYGSVKGQKVNYLEIREIYEGLKNIGVKYDAILTGYTPDGLSLEEVGKIGYDLKKRNDKCLWLLDPVMGDEGELYVDKDVIPIYQKILKQGAVDIITPNQFEAELLVGYEITSIEVLKKALNDLHNKFHVKNVVISSLKLDHQSKLNTVTSRVDEEKIFSNLFGVPYIESYFTGVGDLFSALLIDRIYNKLGLVATKELLDESVNEVLSVMSNVLKVTSEKAKEKLGTTKSEMGSASTMKECELRVIECRNFYCSKEKKFNSVVI